MNTRIIAVVDDMFFAAKIRGAAGLTNTTIDFARSPASVIELAKESKAALIIIDLHSPRFDVFELARQFKTDESLRDVHLLGFYSHVHVELQRKAKDAGFDRVMPRSVFSKHLIEILQLKF
ncbi:MAG: hypothetical protein H0V88_12070 [Pyrinomonadaceae bacterium]|nr:hypothetical protein [Pyrinomonadaceae bacterium]